VVKQSGVTNESFVELKNYGRITHTLSLWNSDFKLITSILNSGSKNTTPPPKNGS
jgi:hypothetical protein